MALSETFMSALENGHLSSLRSFLIDDQSLCPEIRKDTLTIYYRGGSLLNLQESPGKYLATFDESYTKFCLEPRSQAWASKVAALPKLLKTEQHVERWLSAMPFLKSVMDRWFVQRNLREREVQQRIILENNRDGSFANKTDFYFCDMEFVENQHFVEMKRKSLRCDLVGVHWPSTASARTICTDRSLVIAEAKYGDGALQNLVKHYRDIQELVRDERRLLRLKEMLTTHFQQKHRLGLIEAKHPLKSFSDGPVLWLLILINHDPESERLQVKLADLNQFIGSSTDSLIQVHVATSNFMGYGLWDEGIVKLDTFLREAASRI